MLFAVPGLGGGAAGELTDVPPPPPLPDDDGDLVADLACIDCMTLSGFTVAGWATEERVCAATFITMRSCRSCSSSASDLLFVNIPKAGARLLAPVPFGLIMYDMAVTMATRNAATPIAGKTTPVRRSRPFFFRALRDLGSGPVFRDAPLKDGPFR